MNCVVRRGDELVGENTDGQGFLAALRTVVDPAGRSIALFGAGGAARAIAVEATLAGAAHVTVINRDPARGQELVSLIRSRTPADAELLVWDQPVRVPAGATVVVNGTSIGLADPEARLAFDPDSLSARTTVADVIPNPPRTALIRDAAERGCVVLDGMGMLVEQAVISIRHWTGRRRRSRRPAPGAGGRARKLAQGPGETQPPRHSRSSSCRPSSMTGAGCT